MNPLRKAIHVFMESTRLDRLVDERAINHRRELRRAQRFNALDAAAGNRWIGETIAAGKPAAVGTLGAPACGVLAAHLGVRKFYKYTWAAPGYSEAKLPEHGVFPATDEVYWRFSELYLERLQLLDGYAVNVHHGESQALERACPEVRRFDRRALEPYLFDAPWSAQLAGKRVLIVHPFEPSIRAQFARRTALWPQRPEILPACELDVARSPHGFARSGFNDWFVMLQWFEQRIAAIHQRWKFDVALVGCGLCGIPVAASVKKLGAVGIHVGESLPTLFGIRTPNAEQRPEVKSFFNESWVTPQASELSPIAAPAHQAMRQSS